MQEQNNLLNRNFSSLNFSSWKILLKYFCLLLCFTETKLLWMFFVVFLVVCLGFFWLFFGMVCWFLRLFVCFLVCLLGFCLVFCMVLGFFGFVLIFFLLKYSSKTNISLEFWKHPVPAPNVHDNLGSTGKRL